MSRPIDCQMTEFPRSTSCSWSGDFVTPSLIAKYSHSICESRPSSCEEVTMISSNLFCPYSVTACPFCHRLLLFMYSDLLTRGRYKPLWGNYFFVSVQILVSRICCLSRRRSRVRAPSTAPLLRKQRPAGNGGSFVFSGWLLALKSPAGAMCRERSLSPLSAGISKSCQPFLMDIDRERSVRPASCRPACSSIGPPTLPPHRNVSP